MSNKAHLRPLGRKPARGRNGSIPDAFRDRRPVYQKDLRFVRERVMANPEVKKFLGEANRDAG